MADNLPGTTPPAGEGQPPAGNQPPATTPPAGDGQPPAQQETPEVLRAKLEKSVQAEKNLRARLKEAETAEAKLKELQDKDLSEVERLKKELATKEKAAADAAAETRKLKVQVIAQANGFRPDAAALWLGTQQLSDESDDGIKAALAGAPDWVKATTGTTTPPNNPTRQQTTLTKETLKKMSAQEIAKLDEKLVDQVMASG
jgi:hypothetical protein